MSLLPRETRELREEPKPTVAMKIEAVVTCVNHADFLAHTLPLNKPLFDSMIVATAPEDKETQRVCDYWGVRYHATDAFQARWGHFCKGAAINEALQLSQRTDWLCHLDADIALPPHTRATLERADLDPLFIYGIDRFEFKSYAQWQRFIGKPAPHTEGNGFFIDMSHAGAPIATRVAFQHAGGYIPIGFFQLWNAQSGVLDYIAGHSDAGREDSHFAAQWPRRRRHLIPEITAYHLESEFAEMGVNWKGRKTKPFGIGE
jgi:hypothetical protein